MNDPLLCITWLTYLSVPGHSESDKSLVEGRRVRACHVQRLVLEEVLVHLVRHRHLLPLGNLLPLCQVRRLLVEVVNSLKKIIKSWLDHKIENMSRNWISLTWLWRLIFRLKPIFETALAASKMRFASKVVKSDSKIRIHLDVHVSVHLRDCPNL